MKNKLPILALLSLFSLTLGACANGTTKESDNNEDNNNGEVTPVTPTDPTDPDDPDDPVDPDDPDDPVDPDDPDDPIDTEITIQDETILHAWNWSMTNIQNSLSAIKNAGFHTVQISPMQPQKDYYTGQGWSGQWWKLYQPLGFTIAGNNQNVLGTKSQLASLCSAAKAQGIKIIVDVVTNHLAGGNKTSLNGNVGNFESEIYNNNLIHTLGKDADDNNLQSIVQGNIGDYPDLKTEDTRVQNRVISMLKEYIDCGVSGFRFDAAKHIETPDDGNYASNYWPNVLNAATSYATSKGMDAPYVYGEILYRCGTGRSYSSYTKYMSVVDSTQSGDVLTAVKNKNASSIPTNYNSGVNADHLVLWAESHDNYANDYGDNTRSVSSEIINKTYIVQASRKDATTLYFARPGNGEIGSIGSTDYQKASITAINEFHSKYANQKESITKNNGIFVNVRGNSNQGAAIVNIGSDATSATVSVNLANGTYIDLITDKSYNVNNGSVTVNFTDGACILVPESATGSVPSISVNPGAEVFKDSTNISISVSNAQSSYYQINGGSKQSFTGSISFSVGSGLTNGEIAIKVTATNAAGSSVETKYLLKTTLVNSSLIIKNVPDLQSYSYLVWSWSNNSDGGWYDGTIDNNMIGFNFSNSNYIVVQFASGTTASSANWDNKIKQTSDLTLSNQVVDYSSLGF